jgi:hypothetical protein
MSVRDGLVIWYSPSKPIGKQFKVGVPSGFLSTGSRPATIACGTYDRAQTTVSELREAKRAARRLRSSSPA